MTVTLATLAGQGWCLRDALEAHKANPEGFWIPEEDARQNLDRGDAAYLIFDIECVDEFGDTYVQGERIYVLVSERLDGGHYLGLLDNTPVSVDEAHYLKFGVEIVFGPQHIIDIARPPEDYIEWQLGQAPERKWPL